MIPELHILEDADEDALHRDSDVPFRGALGGEVTDDPARSRESGLRRAAVLLPLVRHEAAWHLLFIRRAVHELDRHSGQVAFPGGARDEEDASDIETALREAREEIGLDASGVRVLGTLPSYLTVTNYEVVPVAAAIDWPTPLRLEPREVARTFLLPLDWLRERDNFTLRARRDVDPASARRHPVVVYEPFDGETLWGASARITLNFLKAIDDGVVVLPPIED